MTTIQKLALAIMAEENIGAIIVNGYGWVWPEQVRSSEEVAYAVICRWFR